MRGVLIVLAGLCLACTSATSAFAQGGTGLYEPFPAPRAEEHSLDFVHGLKGERERLQGLTGDDLKRGVALGAASGGKRAGLASQRGQPAVGFAPSMGWLLGLTLLAVVGASAYVAVSRRT
jgi:hypothetical protein